MEIKTLQGVPVAVIADVFNEAFSDYKIKFNVTEESFLKKFEAEAIYPEYSAGAFADGRLVGFILHGLDEIDGQKRVFNAGTGVVPRYRGQQLTEKMYTYILPELRRQGYRHHQLEVLHDNLTAKRIYEKLGFKDVWSVATFKGLVAQYASEGITIKKVPELDWELARSSIDVEPTWQNNTQCIRRSRNRHKFFTAFFDGGPAGFAALDTYNGRLKQFGVKPEFRRRGVGHALFAEVGKQGEVNFINYDLSDAESIGFFNKLGLQKDFELYEMKMYY